MGLLQFVCQCGVLLLSIFYVTSYTFQLRDKRRDITSGRLLNFDQHAPHFIVRGSEDTPRITNTTPNRQLIFPKSTTDISNEWKDISDTKNLGVNAHIDKDKSCSPEYGKIKFSGKCTSILSQGPCPEDFWVILDNDGIAECERRPCPLGKLKYQGNCIDVNSRGICNKNEILYVEYSGHVYCDCEPMLVYYKELDQCIQQHTQGKCPRGKYVELNEYGDITCVNNRCTVDTEVYNPDDGKCYKKVYAGICGEKTGSATDHDHVIIYTDSMEAECSSLQTRNIFEVPALHSCPGGSKRDFLNRCRQTFVTQRSNNPFSFRVPTLHTASNYVIACPAGYRKYPNNSCQKPNSIFG